MEDKIEKFTIGFTKDEKGRIEDCIAYKQYGLALVIAGAILVQSHPDKVTDETRQEFNTIIKNFQTNIRFDNLVNFKIKQDPLEKVYFLANK